MVADDVLVLFARALCPLGKVIRMEVPTKAAKELADRAATMTKAQKKTGKLTDGKWPGVGIAVGTAALPVGTRTDGEEEWIIPVPPPEFTPELTGHVVLVVAPDRLVPYLVSNGQIIVAPALTPDVIDKITAFAAGKLEFRLVPLV